MPSILEEATGISTEVPPSLSSSSCSIGGELVELARTGRYVAARRMQSYLESNGGIPSSVLDTPTLERIRRTSGLYEDTAKLLQMKVTENNPDLKLHWAFHCDGIVLQTVVISEFAGNFVKGLALSLERDLEDILVEDEVSVSPLGHQHAHDGLWHRISTSKSTGAKLDDVHSTVAIDALDEALGAIWACSCTVGPAVTEVRGVAIPPAAPGYCRSPAMTGVFVMVPLGASSGKGEAGFVKVEASITKLSPNAAKFFDMVPEFALRTLMRTTFERQAEKMNAALEQAHCPQLDDRIKDSPRATFYTHVRQHLAG